MGPSRRTKPTRVTRTYGRWTLLGLLSPMLTSLMVSLGIWSPHEPETLSAAQRDAQRMVDDGYRVVSSDEYAIPLFGVAFLKVTYELVDAV